VTMGLVRLMRVQAVRPWALCVAALVLASSAVAQEGYPLTGTWYGSWGTETQRHDLTVVLSWDGREPSGFVLAGTDQVPIKSVVMDVTPAVPAPEGEPSTSGTLPEFHVRFELDAPSAAGGIDSFVFEGEMFNAIASNRGIRGTWKCGDETGTFQVRRL
jgi:hypothetical protein